MSVERFLHVLRIGLKCIAVQPLRSSLTILGLILGVASVIIMLAVGEAAKREAIQKIKDLGAANIIIRSVKPLDEDKKDRGRELLLSYGLTSADLERIRETIPTVTEVTPLREFRKELRYLDRNLEGRVVGVMPNYLEMNGLTLSRGRFLTDLDNQRFANVCVLGAEAAEKLFPLEDPVGRSIRIGGTQFYQVVGITGWRAPTAGIGSSLTAQDYNRDVYIPFQTDRVRFGRIIFYIRAGSIQLEKLEISQVTVKVDRMEHVKKTAEIIDGLLQMYHPRKDTAITVPLDLLEKAEETQRLFTLVLAAIASISLVVGGIGVMNIMLATVTERTREIGIRRALGAKQRDINLQFLMEAVVLSSAGGFLGVGLGLALTFALDYFSLVPTSIQAWSPLVAFSVSVAVGLVFGTYPARRAARLDPIEALRHE